MSWPKGKSKWVGEPSPPGRKYGGEAARKGTKTAGKLSNRMSYATKAHMLREYLRKYGRKLTAENIAKMKEMHADRPPLDMAEVNATMMSGKKKKAPKKSVKLTDTGLRVKGLVTKYRQKKK